MASWEKGSPVVLLADIPEMRLVAGDVGYFEGEYTDDEGDPGFNIAFSTVAGDAVGAIGLPPSMFRSPEASEIVAVRKLDYSQPVVDLETGELLAAGRDPVTGEAVLPERAIVDGVQIDG
jgi:hypothetical protein